MSSRKQGLENKETRLKSFLSCTENPHLTHSWPLTRSIPGLLLLPCDQGNLTAVMNEEEQWLKPFVVLPSLTAAVDHSPVLRCGFQVSRQGRWFSREIKCCAEDLSLDTQNPHKTQCGIKHLYPMAHKARRASNVADSPEAEGPAY